VSAADWAKRRAGVARAERRLAALPTSETGHGAAVPWPYVDRKEVHSSHSNEQINARIADAPVEDVPLDSLHAIQHSVKPARVEQYVRDPAMKPPGELHDKARTPTDHPVVIKQGGKNILWDGHHRSTASYLRGDKTIRARVVDFDAEP
jgi:hypothetical protein